MQGNNLSPIAAIVFDFDGVIVESNHIKTEGYYSIFSISPEDGRSRALIDGVLAELRGQDRYAIIPRLRAQLIHQNPPETEALVRAYNEYCESRTAAARETPGAAAALQDLAAEYPLFINSATPDEPLGRIVRARGLDAWIRQTYGSAHSKESNLAAIAGICSVDARQLLFIGDAPADQHAAQTAGCQFLGFSNDSNRFHAELEYSIKSLAEIRAHIKRIDAAIARGGGE